jgi:hypothetical protein
MKIMKKKEMKITASDLARKGGKATFKKYGKSHFSKIAKARWKKERAKAKKK